MKKAKKEYVEYILREYPESRNSDKVLVYLYWDQFINKDKQYLWKSDIITDFIEDTPYESITRCRRHLQKNGKYLSDKQIKAERDRLENEMRKEFSPND